MASGGARRSGGGCCSVLVARHVGSDAREDGGADEVAVGVLGHLDATAVELQLGALVDTRLDQRLDARLGLLGDNGTDVGVGLVASVDDQLLGTGHQLRDPERASE